MIGGDDEATAAADEAADQELMTSRERRRWLRAAPAAAAPLGRFPVTPERLALETSLAEVRAAIMAVLSEHEATLRAARMDHRMSYDLIAARLGVRRHELLVAMIPEVPW